MTDFKVMNDREYMLHRPEIFIGSMQESEYFGIYNYKYQGLKYVPGLLKIIEEILDNSVDESIRTNFEYANKIDVDIHDDPMYGLSITITDNGRGIPVIQYDGVYQAELSWTRPRAGTNFKDDGRVTIGRNGVGSACTCFLSKEFIGKSCDGNQEVIVKATNNAETIETIIHKNKKRGTSVKFIPDLKRFNLESFSDVYITLIKDRLFNLSLCYPDIEFRFNGEKFKSTLSNMASSFHDNAISLKTENEFGTIIIAPSGEDEEFRHLSYFNGLNIKNGGNHIDYIIQGICSELIPSIKKKWKIDVLPNQIKQHLLLAIWVRNFPELKFDSQSKERVTNTHGELKSFLNIDFQKLVKKIINTEDIIMPMIDAILRKKEAADKRAATNALKKVQKKKILNHISANSKDFEEKTIFLAEGQCVEENSIIFTTDGYKCIKDVKIGDKVMTHDHNIKIVTSTSPSLKKGIKLNGRIYSRKHKLYVYDKELDVFDFIEVQSLIKDRHQLVKNMLIAEQFQRSIHKVTKIVNNVLYTDDDDICIEFSDTHEILLLEDNKIITKTIINIKAGDLIVL